MGDLTILCFGDSNTHGTVAMEHMDDIRRFPRERRWPTVMADRLGDGYEVVAEGHPGRTSAFEDPVEGEHKSGLRILPALLETHRPVDLLVVLLGTNDLKARLNLPAIDIAFALERLAVTARQHGFASDGGPTRVLFVSPVPIEETGYLAEMFAGGAVKSRALAGHLSAIAARQGAGFLDLAGTARVDPVDGVHLDAAGQEAVGRAIAGKALEMFGKR